MDEMTLAMKTLTEMYLENDRALLKVIEALTTRLIELERKVEHMDKELVTTSTLAMKLVVRNKQLVKQAEELVGQVEALAELHRLSEREIN